MLQRGLSFILMIVSGVFLLSCQSFSDFQRDVNNVWDETQGTGNTPGEPYKNDGNPYAKRYEYAAIPALPSPVSRHGIVVSDQRPSARKKKLDDPYNLLGLRVEEKPLAEPKITEKKPKEIAKTTPKEKREEKISSEPPELPGQQDALLKIMKAEAIDCKSDHGLKAEKTISNLYSFYMHVSEGCTPISYKKHSAYVYSLIVTQRKKQDIRLLNADPDFADFTFELAGYAPPKMKEKGTELIDETSCGLIQDALCSRIKKL
ncbi:MAG: hypothetical protein AAF621_03415 [Pseudomonadota bacterium]